MRDSNDPAWLIVIFMVGVFALLMVVIAFGAL